MMFVFALIGTCVASSVSFVILCIHFSKLLSIYTVHCCWLLPVILISLNFHLHLYIVTQSNYREKNMALSGYYIFRYKEVTFLYDIKKELDNQYFRMVKVVKKKYSG